LEFHVLWQDFAKDSLPEPFLFTAEQRTAGELDAASHAARSRLEAKCDNEIGNVLETVHDPDLFLMVYGWNARRPTESETKLRILLTRRGAKGYVLTQLPGPSFWHSGGYIISECDPLTLADRAVAAMPFAEGGRHESRAVKTRADDEIDYEFGRSAVLDMSSDPNGRPSLEFGSAAAESVGEIHIVQGRSVFGPRGRTTYVLRWRDLDHDGRYVVADDNPAIALAADAGRLAGLINSRIAAIVKAIREERR
jgi:hypothetical protein